jgi:hypothetical protein
LFLSFFGFEQQLYKKKLEYCFAKSAKRILNINLFNESEAEQYKILDKLNILPSTYRLLYHYLCFIFIVIKNCKLELNKLIEINSSRKDLRSVFSLPKINKDIKLYSLIITILKTVNFFKKKNIIIKNCKTSEFKTYIKKKIKNIYENSCFKMDTIYFLEFDKEKYYEELNRQKLIQQQTFNSND